MHSIPKSNNKLLVNLLLFSILFFSFFEYIFMYTKLHAFKIHMTIVIAIFVVLIIVSLKQNIKHALIWAPFYILILFHWFVTRFSTYYLLIYLSAFLLPSFCFSVREKHIESLIKTIQIFAVFFATGCLFQQFLNDVFLAIVPNIFLTSFRSSFLVWNYYGICSGFSHQPTAAAAAINISKIPNLYKL